MMAKKWMDFLSIKVLGLPIVLTEKNDSPWIRVLGLLLGFIWLLPAFFILMIPFSILATAITFEEVWKSKRYK